MDSQDYYDDKLTTIKVFNTYLSSIIDKGYNNEIDILLLIVKHINNFIDEHIELNKTSILPKELIPDEPMFVDDDIYKKSSSSENIMMLSVSESDSDAESETDSETDSEDNIKSYKEKELNKIKKFIENSDDLSKIYIYMKKNNKINKMKRFIKKSLEY